MPLKRVFWRPPRSTVAIPPRRFGYVKTPGKSEAPLSFPEESLLAIETELVLEEVGLFTIGDTKLLERWGSSPRGHVRSPRQRTGTERSCAVSRRPSASASAKTLRLVDDEATELFGLKCSDGVARLGLSPGEEGTHDERRRCTWSALRDPAHCFGGWRTPGLSPRTRHRLE